MEEKNEENNDVYLDFQRNLFIGLVLLFVILTIIMLIYSFFNNSSK